MSDQVKFAVGDRVRFKPSDHWYRDKYHAPEEFVVLRVWGEAAYWDDATGFCAFFKRLELTGGPW